MAKSKKQATPEEPQIDFLKELTPQEYFDYVKGKKNKITSEDLARIYDNTLSLLNKYSMTGQVKAMKKLVFLLECIEKEKAVIQMGVDTFVYRSDIEEYMDNIAKDVVVIQELRNYQRDIPNEIAEIVAKTKTVFDEFYVVFTDYTGKTRKTVAAEQRKKDPILFGTFQNRESRAVVDRFYFLGDWEDEFCDLTLERMVEEVKATGKDIAHKIITPEDIATLKHELARLDESESGFTMNTSAPKRSWFSRIKTLLKIK